MSKVDVDEVVDHTAPPADTADSTDTTDTTNAVARPTATSSLEARHGRTEAGERGVERDDGRDEGHDGESGESGESEEDGSSRNASADGRGTRASADRAHKKRIEQGRVVDNADLGDSTGSLVEAVARSRDDEAEPHASSSSPRPRPLRLHTGHAEGGSAGATGDEEDMDHPYHSHSHLHNGSGNGDGESEDGADEDSTRTLLTGDISMLEGELAPSTVAALVETTVSPPANEAPSGSAQGGGPDSGMRHQEAARDSFHLAPRGETTGEALDPASPKGPGRSPSYVPTSRVAAVANKRHLIKVWNRAEERLCFRRGWVKSK